ncbi:MAG: class I SAM-dependent methyltransferase [Syntrophaceae bacterium]|nr:class I SAM-dependent methyltransferase [Syntrophaceae bacterium]
MSHNKASITALATAYMRAAHQLLETKPLIFDDPVGLKLLGPEASKNIQDMTDHYQNPEIIELRTRLILRARFTEDRLAAAFSRGVRQYIILGAGFDTFALRQPSWAKELKIVEVDHLGSQSPKRSYIDAAGLAVPKNVSFVDIDFKHESLHEGLLRYNVSINKPAFFSWLGVMIYLKEEAINAVLYSVAMFPVGSEIILTFVRPPGDCPSIMTQSVADIGEPWISYFEPEEIEAKLYGLGFSKVEFLTHTEAEMKYFRPRPKDLPVPKEINILSAIR